MGCGCSGPTSELLQFLDIEAPEDFNERVSDKSLSMALEPSLLHQAYSIVLGQLTLQGAQRMALLRRGLSSANVSALEAQGYRSAPTSWGLRRMVADAVIAEMGEEIAPSLPFLEKSARGWVTAGIEGLLIPFRNAFNQVVGFQVRLPSGSQRRYLWWKAKGSQAGTGAPVHVKQCPGAQLAVIVEGPIKADIVALRWKEVFGETVATVAIPGATAHKDLAAVLSQLGFKRVLLALDQDAPGEKNTSTLRGRLVDAGFEVSVASWPAELGKIDDFILDRSIAAVQLRRELHEEPVDQALPIALPAPAFETMEQARTEAKGFLKDAILGPAGVYALQLEMGGGKTWMAVDLVNELYNASKLQGRSIGLFTTRHEQAEQFAGTADWAKHHGATYKAEGKGFDLAPTEKTPCKNLGLLLRVIESGAPTQLACDVCPKKAVCENNYAKNAGEPFYLAQRNTGKERHLYNANALRDKAVLKDLTDIFLDDIDLERATVENTRQTVEQITQAIKWAFYSDSYRPMESLLETILFVQTRLRRAEYKHDHPRLTGEELQDALAEKLGGIDALREVLAYALTAEDPSPFDEHGAVRTNIPHRIFIEAARRLAVELEQRGNASCNPMVSIDGQGLSVWKRSEIDFSGKRVYILNADQAAEQYQRLFPGAAIEVFKAPVEMPDRTRVVQHYEGPFSRKHAGKLVQLVIEKFEERAKAFPWETPADWGCVSFPIVIEALKARFPGINARYYGNQTGSNELENVSFLVLAGDHKPNPHGFLEEAQAIYGNSARIDASPKWFIEELKDRSGNVVKTRHRGYIDPRLDERWLLVSIGENRQGFGRARPWNTGNHQAMQGDFFEAPSAPKRQLEICVLSSYALPGIIPDLLVGERVDIEGDLVAAALELRRAGQRVTADALKAKTEMSLYYIKEHLDRVKLRSEAEFFALNVALGASPAMNLFREVVFAPVLESRCRMTSTCIASVVDPQRGPPLTRNDQWRG